VVNIDTLHDHDFVHGLLYALRLRGQTSFGYDAVWFSQSVYAAYLKLQVLCEEGLEVRVRFFMRPHEIHGDSVIATQALGDSIGQSIAPFEAPYYDAFNIRIDEDSARELLEHLPLPLETWLELADTFMEAYRNWRIYGSVTPPEPERHVRRDTEGPYIL
jgi:hypothetical protein